MKWGIIGPGKIARQFAEALAESKQGQLYAVASRNAERANSFAKQYGADVSYDNYAALMADKNVDLIYIATPHSHHFPLAKACLSSGKHLLLEKPITLNAQQAQVLVSLSEKNNVLFQEALWSRFMPCLASIKSWIDEGKIGEVQYISSQIGFAFAETVARIQEPMLAGGGLLDLGIYPISISQFLLGEHPTNVQASATFTNKKVDNNCFVNLTYASGVTSQFVCSINADTSNEMRIQGSEGHISIPAAFWDTTAATLHQKDNVQNLSFPHVVNGFEYQIEETMNNVKRGLSCATVMSHSDSIGILKTMDTIRQQIGLEFSAEIESAD